MGRLKGSKNKIKSEPAGPAQGEDGFKHLFEAVGQLEVYEWIVKTAPENVQTPTQRLVALCKRAKDIATIHDDKYGGKRK